ncbi:MAG: hypothetical protein ACXWE7_12335 [Nitrososphaeraceae archaeon]
MKLNPINVKQDHLLTITIVVVALLLFCSGIYTNQIFGHNFAGDESATFLALMDQIQTEMDLINTNLVANNQSLAMEHLNNIDELYTKYIKNEIAERNKRIANEISSVINETSVAIEKNNQDTSSLVKKFNEIIGEAISVRIDQDTLTNATVHALHFANLINSIDLSYADALGTKPMNMSSMNMGDDNSKSHDNNNKLSSTSNKNNTMSDMKMNHGDSSMASMSKDTDNNSNATENGTVANIASYQTAKELTNNAIDLFNSTIKQNIPSNATDNANAIESGLQQLKDMIESNASYDKVMGIIHGILQTNTQEIFNLPLKTSK